MGSKHPRHGRPRTARHLAMLAIAVVGCGVAMLLSVVAISGDRTPALWTVDGEVGASSQIIPIRAAHPGCPSWSNLGGLVVDVIETDADVTVVASFPVHPDDTPCRWMGNAMPSSVKLESPLGDRALIDGGTGKDPATPAAIAFRTGQAPGA